MDNKTICRIYRTVMLVILTAFITFLMTSVGLYAYVKNDGNIFLLTRKEIGDISADIYAFKKIIDQNYLGEVDTEKLKEGAIKGYVEGLGDPYTTYISEDELEEYLQNTKGIYVGIGVYLTGDEEQDKVKIISVVKNSPAEKEGILPGDYIISVDDKKYTASQMEELSNDVKEKEEGTDVTVIIEREGETKTITVKTEKIKINPVEGKMLGEGIGYIEFTSFDETTADDFKAKYDELKTAGMTHLIIDLRNNGGGLVDQATKLADYMLEKDSVILYEVDKNGNETAEKAKDDLIIDIPIVILTNKNTASASEIFAGALQDLGKAKIVGTTTYGKGIIQEIISVKGKGAIKLTTQEYQTPNHKKINKIGIEPDIKVELPEDVTNLLDVPEEKDTQLQKAKEIVKTIEEK